MTHPFPSKRLLQFTLMLIALTSVPVAAQDKTAEAAQKLQGFDAFMEKTLKDWNAPT